MSYCRSTADSDVYVFGSGRYLEAYVSNGIPWLGELPHFKVVEMHAPNPEEQMLDYLIELKGKGVKVPEYATDRLVNEAQERMDDART